MNSAAMTTSMAASRDTIGPRAAKHLDIAFRTFTDGQGGKFTPRYLRWTTGEPHPMGNLAVVAHGGTDEDVRAAAQPLVERGVPASVLFSEGASAAALRTLSAWGFDDAGTLPAMAVDIARLPATALPEGCTFARVGAGDEARAWADALAIGYGLPPALARRFSPVQLGADMAVDAATQYFAAVRDDQVVATSLLFLADGLAGIYCVATRPEERGKGLGAHVTAEALRRAHGLGYHVGVLQSSTAGHPVYLRLGFEDVGTLPMVVRMPR